MAFMICETASAGSLDSFTLSSSTVPAGEITKNATGFTDSPDPPPPPKLLFPVGAAYLPR